MCLNHYRPRKVGNNAPSRITFFPLIASAYIMRSYESFGRRSADMFNEDFVDGLPNDDESAFIQIAKAASERAEAEMGGDKSWYRIHTNLFDIIDAAASELNIVDGVELCDRFRNTITEYDDNKGYVSVVDFKSALDALIFRLSIRTKGKRKKFSVGLSQAGKDNIKVYLDKIRDEISKSDAHPDKKDILYGKIADLDREIMQDRTGFQRFLDVIVAIWETSEPARKYAEKILRIIHGEKEREEAEQKQLPEARTRQLPAPKRPEEVEKEEAKSSDDEIPF